MSRPLQPADIVWVAKSVETGLILGTVTHRAFIGALADYLDALAAGRERAWPPKMRWGGTIPCVYVRQDVPETPAPEPERVEIHDTPRILGG